MMKYAIVAFTLIFLLVACESEATPFPVDIPPTETPIPISTDTPQIRYALASNMFGFTPDLDGIRLTALVEQLTESINADDLGMRYDIVVSFGELAGWTTIETPIQVSIVFSDTLNVSFRDVIQQVIDPQSIVADLGMPGAIANYSGSSVFEQVRSELANSGFPDGFSVIVAYAYTPGIASVVAQLDTVNVDAQTQLFTNLDIVEAFGNQEIQVALVTWITTEDREIWTDHFGANNVIDLYSLPISYRAVDGLQISINANGLPLASW